MKEILNSLETGILLIDYDGRVEFANKFCVERGLSLEDFKGKKYYEAVRSLDLIGLIGELVEGKKEEGEFEYRNRVYRVRCKKNTVCIIHIEDITQVKNAEKMQREFIATVSHELSTPLTAVRGFLETMLMSKSYNRTMLEKALKRTKELENLIKSIRLLVLLESENRKLSTEVNLQEIIEEITEDLRGELEEKKINLEIVLEPNITVKCDREKLYILLKNIIENAVRYNGENGSVIIRGRKIPEGIEINIEDTGIGIPKEDIPFIFNPFFSGRNRKGMGLGLAISKKIADFCGADIEIESEEGKGTTVKITFKDQASNL